jgi:hypothetical protein
MQASLPRCGYAAGETIAVKIRYANRSNVKVEHTSVSVWKVTTIVTNEFYVKEVEQSKLVEVFTNGVAEKSSVKFNCALKLPKGLLSSNDRFCRALRVTYRIKIEGLVSLFEKNPTHTIPITIGTIPIKKILAAPTQAKK